MGPAVTFSQADEGLRLGFLMSISTEAEMMEAVVHGSILCSQSNQPLRDSRKPLGLGAFRAGASPGSSPVGGSPSSTSWETAGELLRAEHQTPDG